MSPVVEPLSQLIASSSGLRSNRVQSAKASIEGLPTMSAGASWRSASRREVTACSVAADGSTVTGRSHDAILIWRTGWS